jgi:hypothetical protein
MATSNVKTVKLLDAAVATGAGTNYGTAPYRFYTFTCISTGVTTGATVKVQGTDFGGNVVPLASFTANATANLAANWVGPVQNVKANITAYTDGTHTVYMSAAQGYR